MQEYWKDICGYEGIYEISNYGNIISLEREEDCFRRGKLHRRIRFQKDCRPALSKGYYTVSLSKNGIKKTHQIHSLVAENFIGKRPEGMVIDHIDNNPLNNYYKNLEYVTVRENCQRGKNCYLKKDKSSSFKGVSWHEGAERWRSHIFFNKKTIHLGSFMTEDEAFDAYIKFSKEKGIL